MADFAETVTQFMLAQNRINAAHQESIDGQRKLIEYLTARVESLEDRLNVLSSIVPRSS